MTRKCCQNDSQMLSHDVHVSSFVEADFGNDEVCLDCASCSESRAEQSYEPQTNKQKLPASKHIFYSHFRHSTTTVFELGYLPAIRFLSFFDFVAAVVKVSKLISKWPTWSSKGAQDINIYIYIYIYTSIPKYFLSGGL